MDTNIFKFLGNKLNFVCLYIQHSVFIFGVKGFDPSFLCIVFQLYVVYEGLNLDHFIDFSFLF